MRAERPAELPSARPVEVDVKRPEDGFVGIGIFNVKRTHSTSAR